MKLSQKNAPPWPSVFCLSQYCFCFSLFLVMTARWQCCCSLHPLVLFKCPSALIVSMTPCITSAEVTAKAIRSHSRYSVVGPWFQTRWSMSCLSHSQTTSMSYSSLASMQTCWQTRTVCTVSLWMTQIWMPGENSRERRILHHNVHCDCCIKLILQYSSLSNEDIIYLDNTFVKNEISELGFK